MVAEIESNLICSHLGIGASILIGFAASEISGALTIIALPITAFIIFLSAYCNSKIPKNLGKRRRDFGDSLEYFGIWMGILEKMTAAATCARIASATIDYTSGGKFRDFLLGLESHSLGEPWPDVLGVTIIFVVTLLFMLGLEKSTYFSVLLYCGIFTSFLFFVLVGGYYTNIRTSHWLQEFRTSNYQTIMSATGMCAFGFSSTLPTNITRNRKLKLSVLILFPLLMYVLITVVYTFMSHYREVSGTAIPLVKVFEVRDVGWARPIMAVNTICVVCLALTEIIPALYDKIVILANTNWQILIVPLLYKSTLTGAPILAIFTAGSLTSILAFACPLAYLIPLLNASILLKCSFYSTLYLYNLLKRDFIVSNSPTLTTSNKNNNYSKLRNQSRMKRSSSYKLKVMMDLLPRFLRNSPLNQSESSRSVKSSKTRKDNAGDKEYLLLGDYNKVATSDSESDLNDNSSPNCTDVDESTSSTDIDAVVQEYKDRVQVTTIATEPKRHKQLNKFIVCSTIALIHLSSFILSFDITSKYTSFIWLNCAVLIFCIITMVAITPKSSSDNSPKYVKLMAMLSTISVILNVFFATPLITIVWLAVGLWFLAGLLLFCRCNCCNCEGLYEKEYERMGISTSTNDTSITTTESNLLKEKYIDTIYIQR